MTLFNTIVIWISGFLMGLAVGAGIEAGVEKYRKAPTNLPHKPPLIVTSAKTSQTYLFCKDGDISFNVASDSIYLVIKDAKPSEYDDEVVGTPFAVVMIDTDGVGHLIFDKMPPCVRSNGTAI